LLGDGDGKVDYIDMDIIAASYGKLLSIANFTYPPLDPIHWRNREIWRQLTGIGNITRHAYTDDGNYTITLTVIDNDGLGGITYAR